MKSRFAFHSGKGSIQIDEVAYREERALVQGCDVGDRGSTMVDASCRAPHLSSGDDDVD